MSFCFDSILKHDEFTTVITLGIKEWRSGESARFPPMWLGFKFRRRRHMWVEFVVGSLLCSERFSSGYSGLPLSSKTNISKFQFDQESGKRRTTLWMCYLQIIIYLFIYLFIYSLIIPLGDLWPYRQEMVSLRCPQFTIFLVMNKKNFCTKLRFISLSQGKKPRWRMCSSFWWLLWY